MTGLCQCGCGQPTKPATQSHTRFGNTKGQPQRYVLGHGARTVAPKRYRERVVDGRKVRVHRLRAELALGKPLPSGAEVHHVDGTTSDKSPLVICQDRAYHMLLHKLTRIRRAGGNPHTERICGACKQVLPFDRFYGAVLQRPPRRSDCCRECDAKLSRQRREQRRTL